MSWDALKSQFGQEYADRRNFKRKFQGALKKATAAYKDGRVESVPGGLRLLPSPPPVKRKMVAVSAVPASVSGPSSTAAVVKDLVSGKALEQVPEIAPGWDKYFLAATYKHWICEQKPRNPDAAFLGWVRKFTKSKAP